MFVANLSQVREDHTAQQLPAWHREVDPIAGPHLHVADGLGLAVIGVGDGRVELEMPTWADEGMEVVHGHGLGVLSCYLFDDGVVLVHSVCPIRRHTCAINLLRAGIDVAVIALWMGHADIRSTNAYLHADMTIKQQALARTTSPSLRRGRFKPSDELMAFLSSL